jgi:ABC-type amino acid transport substrate-binding protein
MVGWPPTSSAPRWRVPVCQRFRAGALGAGTAGRGRGPLRRAGQRLVQRRTHPVGQFSGEYLLNRIRFLKRKDAPIEYNDLQQLHSYPIAVVRGYAYSAAFDADTALQKVPVHNFAMAVRMLAADRVKLTLEDEYVARYYLAANRPRCATPWSFCPSR